MSASSNFVRVAVAGGVLAAALAVPTFAGAQVRGSEEVLPQTSTTVAPEVLGNVVEAPRTPPQVATEVLGESVEAGNLAVTGADVAGLTAIGVGALGAGALLLGARRRRNAQA